MQQEYIFKDSAGAIVLRVYQKRIIIAELSGFINEALPRASIAKTADLAEAIKRAGLKPLLLLDATKVTGQNSRARLATQQIGRLDVAKLAVCTRNQALSLIIKYVFQSYKSKQEIQLFKNRSSAQKWLLSTKIQEPSQHWSNIITAALLALISAAALIGWAINYGGFAEYIPKILIMNPVVALSFVTLSAGLIFYNSNSAKPPKAAKIILGTIAAWLFVLGFFVWLRLVFGANTTIDTWLFTKYISAETLTAPRTAINFGLTAVMIWAILTGQPKTWQKYAYFIPATLIFLNSFAVAFGYFFGFSTEMFSPYTPMPLTNALAFILVVRIVRSFSKPIPIFTKAINLEIKYHQPLLVFILAIAFTGVIWQQSKSELEKSISAQVSEEFTKQQNIFEDKTISYRSLLYSFRSLFESNPKVTPNEFTTFFNSSGITGNYPGLNSLSFIKVIPSAQKQQYQNQIRQEASTLNPQLSNFTVHPASNQPISYILTYIEPDKANNKQTLGFDLSSDPQRQKVLEAARDSGLAQATETININSAASDNNSDQPGFFVTAPIYNNLESLGEPKNVEERRQRLTGFINASFVNSEAFGDVFKNTTSKDLQYKIINISTGDTLYTYNPDAKDMQKDIAYEGIIMIGNRALQLIMYVNGNFGATNLERILPTSILIAGALFSTLGAALTLSLARRREAALKLANSITEDLNNERNEAIMARNNNDAILASIGDAVFAIDSKENITLFNHATEKISGFSSEEALGRPYKDILQFVYEGKTKEATFIQRALKGRLSHMHNHTYLIRKDGKKVAVADSAAPFRNEHGKIAGAIIVFRDVTRESELNAAKDEFVSLASHQLRTPLSAINWYIELLESGDAGKLNQQQLEYLNQISTGNQRMVKLVNALLDVSRIDLGKFINETESVSIKKIVTSLIKEAEPGIQAKNITINTDIKSDMPHISIDPKLFVIIIQNLLSNAIKYTGNKGKIVVSVRRACSADHPIAKPRTNKECILISVSDTGFGIPKTQQNRIFEKLFRADNARTKDVEGNGLGLYLVQQIVQRLGGAIWFESVENQGTTFYVSLPLITKQSPINITK